MLKVKILSGSREIVERDINDFLKKIGGRYGIRVEVKDIKLIPEGNLITSMVIYNEFQVVPPAPPTPQQIPPQPPRRAPVPGTPESFR